MSKPLEILVTAGPMKGRRFSVPSSGLRLGRSSSCEISISDPSLSRNHCLFELRDASVWVTDLASANGTEVNGASLGADSRELCLGDVVSAGESSLALVEEGCEPLHPQFAGAPHEAPKIDLGFGRKSESAEAGGESLPVKRLVLWAGAAAAVAFAAFVILSGGGQKVEEKPKALPVERPTLRRIAFEKVEADQQGIYRYALALDAEGTLAVEIDDVPKENRHVKKSVKLSAAARTELEKIFASEELYRLDREYLGVPLKAGTLKSFALRVVRGGRVFETSIENTQEPEPFRAVRERLETFSKNELGIWAIQFSAEKLVEMSMESRRAGDAKWQEREVQYGNVAAALASYREAVFYLETVNPKPADYGALVARRDEAAKELEKRYRDQRFRADRAINLADWPTAQRELRVLCELVPDDRDPRHVEASAKLLDVEQRIKKGGK